jgi:hypothetical protein
VVQYRPSRVSPQCRTRSPCSAPGATPRHLRHVRSGTWARTLCSAGALRRGWAGRRRRRGRNSRSRVAGLAASRAVRAGGGHHDAVVRFEGRHQRGQDRAEELAQEVVAGAPHLLEQRQELPPIARRPPGPSPAAPRRGSQAADRRLAMTPGDPAVLVQDLASLPPRRVLRPPTHHLGILAASSLRHGASFPVPLVHRL